MNLETNAETTRPEMVPPCPPFRYNVKSIIAPLVGSLCGAVVVVICNCLDWWWASSLKAGIITLDAFIVRGFFFAFIALARREKAWVVTIIGLVLNGGLLAFILIA